MKTWNTPAIEELEINETMGGGHWSWKKDGVSYNVVDGSNKKHLIVEEVELVSGV